MTLNRRNLLRGGLALGGSAALGGGLFRAAARASDGPGTDGKNLVVLLNFGGWDTTVSVDPKPGLPRIDGPPEGSVERFGEIPILVHESRPNIGRYFERWASQTAVVNGVQVRSFVHADGVKRILTGGPGETTPDFGAITAHTLGRDLPIPYLAFGAQARSGPYAALTGRTGTVNQLITLTSPESAYATPGSFLPDPGFQPSEEERALVATYLERTTAQARERFGSRGYNGRRVDDFSSSQVRAEQLQRFARENGLGSFDYTPDVAVQVPLGIRALRDGLAKVVLIETGDWDTHANNHPQQAALHDGLFGALDQLVTGLDEEDMLDDTLVVVVSEMGRTPKLNGELGKDHWPVTSAMIVGGSVRGGRTYGATDDELGAVSMDLQSGAVDPGGKQLQTPNFVGGILEAVGVDPAPWVGDVEVFRAFCG